MSFGRRHPGSEPPPASAPAAPAVVTIGPWRDDAARLVVQAEATEMLTATALEAVREAAVEAVPGGTALQLGRSEVSRRVEAAAVECLGDAFFRLHPLERQKLVALVATERLVAPETNGEGAALPSGLDAARAKVQPVLVERIDAAAALKVPREALQREVAGIVDEILTEQGQRLNAAERRALVATMLDEMLGFGPLEPLLADESVTDILVNGAGKVWVERAGKLELTAVRFRDDRHVMNIAQRIVTGVGRRVDETTPLADARLPDGSRVNIVIPPLAIDGPSISIRKFAKRKITLEIMERQANLSAAMAAVLRIAARARLNILISGGTGSGKTTLLNALSRLIDAGERIVTIEDAAELQLQQPHVVRLETRPANLEGQNAIGMRDLVKNALRMRPDRIILGEVRGSEAVDMLQAMNTGHEGSMCTVHANRPREALTRLENMVGLAGINLPARAVRTQIADAVDLVVQISRMRDGVRRLTHIVEVVGMEGEVVTTQDLFVWEHEGEDGAGRLTGRWVATGVRPHFAPKAAYFGLERALQEALR